MYVELQKVGVKVVGTGVSPSATFIDTSTTATLEAGAQVLTVFGAPGESTNLLFNRITITPIQ
ncbi:hypothetical protein [Clostridium psychrophilum]|uniref:hypothetical protein n=1 Tax=Clostridium psychrophilum TaxID=132926 RepID=UPI001C0E2122|nr:hypothetical protein [Clostridium psychrophilum]MBU3183215.1 hypothetical protein [Clostridium psychrophilum]